MARQIDHLADVSQRPNVRLGVIPWGVEATVYPSSGFELYDGRTVAVGSPTGAQFQNDPADVDRYAKLLAALEGLAVFGDAVRELLGRAASEYRR